MTSHLPQIYLLEGLESWQLFARNLLLANTGISMLLGPEYGLVFVIKCPTLNALSPPDSTYCLPRVPVLPPTSTYAAPLRVPAAYLGPLNFAASSKKCQAGDKLQVISIVSVSLYLLDAVYSSYISNLLVVVTHCCLYSRQQHAEIGRAGTSRQHCRHPSKPALDKKHLSSYRQKLMESLLGLCLDSLREALHPTEYEARTFLGGGGGRPSLVWSCTVMVWGAGGT
jgi:hypothetical protein